MDAAVFSVVFDGVSGYINQHLLDVQGASNKIGMGELFLLKRSRQLNLFRRRLSAKNRCTVCKKLRQGKCFFPDFHIAAFQFVDVEHVVYQRQQMFRRSFDFLSAVPLSFRVVRVLLRNTQHTHNTVDRCSDVMGHV